MRNSVCLCVLSLFLWGECFSQTEGNSSAKNEKPAVRLTQGELLELGKGELERAVSIYKDVIAQYPDDVKTVARALYLLARCERKRGNLRRAEQLLEDR